MEPYQQAITGSTPIASPQASPAVAPAAPPPSTADVLEEWKDAQATLAKQGAAVIDAFLAGDEATFKANLSDDMSQALGNASVETMLTSLTKNIVSFRFPEAQASYVGSFTPEEIVGQFYQGTWMPLDLKPEETQTGDVPTGTWTGALQIPQGKLDLSVAFSGTADTMKAELSIPAQGLSDFPMSDVLFEAERPIGEEIDTRSLAIGGEALFSLYGSLRAWGRDMLAMNASFDGEGRLAGFHSVYQPPLPDDPAAHEQLMATLPYRGAWLVFWGGGTEFRNYHASTPGQRHALDLVIWKDGATFTGDGTAVTDYHCYGQSLLAPVSGEVVAVENGYPDTPPNTAAGDDVHPAGNHVVIDAEGGAYVYLAHMVPGSVRVRTGDRVAIGDIIGLVGSSGNSSEPHIHIHAQRTAEFGDPEGFGIPIVFDNAHADGEMVENGKPVQGQIVEPVA